MWLGRICIYGTIQNDTILHSTVRYNILRYDMASYNSSVFDSIVRCNTTLYGNTPYDTI